MSFLKFWSKKGKKDDSDSKRDDPNLDPELEKRRLRHSLSISRSGRFKQRKRERCQITEIFSDQESASGQSNPSSNDNSSQNSMSSTCSSASSSHHEPHNPHKSHSSRPSCRDVNNSNMATPNSLRMGQSVFT